MKIPVQLLSKSEKTDKKKKKGFKLGSLKGKTKKNDNDGDEE